MRNLEPNPKRCVRVLCTQGAVVGALAGLALLSSTVSAQADVMELGTKGFVWVAGAPKTAAPDLVEVGPRAERRMSTPATASPMALAARIAVERSSGEI